MKEPVVSAKNLRKSYWLYPSAIRRVIGCFLSPERVGGTPLLALSGLTFNLYPGEALALIGKNGAGKSTALQLLAGIIPPTEGEYITRGRVCALLELGSGFNPEFTGRENIAVAGMLAGLSQSEIDASEKDIIDFADIGIYIDQPLKFYSSGMFLRLAFAVALAGKPDILVVDEALAVGDIFFRQKCYNRLRELRNQGMAVLLVTHNMNDVTEFCDRALLLEHGHQIFCGNPNEAANLYCSQYDRAAPNISSSFCNIASLPSPTSSLEHAWWYKEPGVIELSPHNQQNPTGVYFRRVWLSNKENHHTTVFNSGDSLRVHTEIYTPAILDVPIIGFLLNTASNFLVYGNNSFFMEDHGITSIPSNSCILVELDINLPLAPGEYTLSLGFSEMPEAAYHTRKGKDIKELESMVTRLCFCANKISFRIKWKYTKYGVIISHYGQCNLGCTSNIKIAYK